MTQSKDPTHWLDPDSDVPDSWRRLLLAQDCEPSEERLNRFSMKLSGALGAAIGLGLNVPYEAATTLAPSTHPPAPWAGQPIPQPPLGTGTGALQAGAGASKALSVGGWTAGNWAIVSAVTGASLLAGVALVREVVKSPNGGAEVAVQAPAPARAKEAPVVKQPEVAPSAQEPAPAPAVTPRAVEPAKTSNSGRRAERAEAPAGAKENQEAELLAAAQRALGQGRAEAALDLTRQHQALSRPVLVQERERLAIEALLRLGRTAAAKERATRFRRNFPSSGYLPRIDSLFSGEEKTPKP